ncbi:nuclease-related domain-containing protein [Klebsiella quasipneumoniae]|uniref:nuclease-related domain-containing protein n=1 Tax=Klebsiella quasipneumoniae TaxID=1463165 RepID=UPI00388D4B65
MLIKELLSELEGDSYPDVTLPLNSSQTTQIDHIFICKKGIFIIEEKHYSGDLYGALDDKIGRRYTVMVKRSTG